MSENTAATVIIAAADQAQAQADMGDGFFTVGLSATGEAPATHFMSSGFFLNEELDAIVNTYTWPKKIYFGQDWQAALAAQGLQLVQEPVASD